jgi:hypothetical protein
MYRETQVSTSQRTQIVFIIQAHQLMQFREIFCVHSKNNVKYSTWQNVEFLTVTKEYCRIFYDWGVWSV